MLRRFLKMLMVLMVLGACGDLRVKVDVFNSVEEARRGGAIAAGWIPERVPAGATDLREGHLPDGRHWGVFAFQRADENAVRALVTEEITAGTLACDPPGRLEFWPRLLLSPVDVERVRSTGFRLYRAADGRTYAINWGQGRAYYWK
ncbi:MAG TPA: hypothetical protein VEL51_15145 [Vicinamibacterales bacterium]|nr:hypothetical protein [Vicinamibacterales bacterium]